MIAALTFIITTGLLYPRVAENSPLVPPGPSTSPPPRLREALLRHFERNRVSYVLDAYLAADDTPHVDPRTLRLVDPMDDKPDSIRQEIERLLTEGRPAGGRWSWRLVSGVYHIGLLPESGAAWPRRLSAQGRIYSDERVNFTVTNREPREVLEAILRSAGRDFVIHMQDDLKSVMSTEVRDGTLTEAVRKVADRVGKGYTFELARAGELNVLRMVRPAGFGRDPNGEIVSLRVRDYGLRDALSALFTAANVPYALDPEIPNVRIAAFLRGVKFRTALESLLIAGSGEARLTYRFEGGKYSVFPKEAEPPPERLVTFSGVRTDLANALKMVCAEGGLKLLFDRGAERIAGQLPVVMNLKAVPARSAVDTVIREAVGPLNELLEASWRQGVCTVGPGEYWDRIELPASRMGFSFGQVRSSDALRSVLEAFRVSYALYDDPTDQTRVSLDMGEQSPLASLVGVLKVVPEEKRPSVTAYPGFVCVQTRRFDNSRRPSAGLFPISLQVRDGDIRYVLKCIMIAMGKNYTLDQGIRGYVSMSGKAMSPEYALQFLLRVAPIRFGYRSEGEVYNFLLD